MVNTIVSTLISIGLGVLLAVPALILGYLLKKAGAPNRSIESLLFCIVMSLVNQFLFIGAPFKWFALLTIAGSTLGVYRMDIYWASKKEASKETNSNDNSKP